MKRMLLNLADAMLSREQMKGVKGGTGYPGSGGGQFSGYIPSPGQELPITGGNDCWQGPPGTTIFNPSNANACNQQFLNGGSSPSPTYSGSCTRVSCGGLY